MEEYWGMERFATSIIPTVETKHTPFQPPPCRCLRCARRPSATRAVPWYFSTTPSSSGRSPPPTTRASGSRRRSTWRRWTSTGTAPGVRRRLWMMHETLKIDRRRCTGRKKSIKNELLRVGLGVKSFSSYHSVVSRFLGGAPRPLGASRSPNHRGRARLRERRARTNVLAVRRQRI